MRGTKWMAGTAIVTGLLSGCATQTRLEQEGSGDSIRLAGHGDSSRCDDPAYESIKKVLTFTLHFGDGQTINLCRPETPDRASPGQRGDLIIEFPARDPEPETPIALYRKAKRAGNMRDAWGAILIAQTRDATLADRMWRDYWQSAVLPTFHDRPRVAFGSLKAAAERGLPSAMARLGEAYRKGEFGLQVDEQLSAHWTSKAEAAKAASAGAAKD